MKPPRRFSPLARWGAGVGLVVAAWGVIAVTPDDHFADQVFVEHAHLDTAVDGRDIRITLLDFEKAQSVQDAHGWHADGTWVVATFEAEALTNEKESNLQRIELHIGDRTYTPSDRPDERTTPLGHLAVGIPATMTAAFEIDADDAAEHATLEIAYDKIGRVLDSEIDYDADLAKLRAVPSAKIADRKWSE